MSEFKQGDRVRCVDANVNSGALVEGQEYTVDNGSASGGIVHLEGVVSWQYASRFELVSRNGEGT